MKPYGREKKIKGGKCWKRDHHPPKGYMNWWEDICDYLSRGAIKHQVKKEIDDEINNNEN